MLDLNIPCNYGTRKIRFAVMLTLTYNKTSNFRRLFFRILGELAQLLHRMKLEFESDMSLKSEVLTM